MSKVNNVLNSLYSKILFSLLILIICRLGSYIPIPGINALVLSKLFQNNESGILGLFNLLSGGSLGRMSIFALAIVPYITSSIIIQLLTIAIKPLENIKNEGEHGRKKINQITRLLTVFLSMFQSYGIAITLISIESNAELIIINHNLFKLITMITLTVGTITLMWLGEQINIRGIGNGISLIIFSGIVSQIPSSLINFFELSRTGSVTFFNFFMGLTIAFLTLIIIIFFEKAQRKIPVQYPQKQIGHGSQGNESFIPLKINMSGVIPPIFADSILLFPLTIVKFAENKFPFMNDISIYLDHGKPVYLILYSIFIIFFSFFYTAIVFNSEETANNLKKNGSFILGKRPGKPTAEFFDYVIMRITVIGSIYLILICCLPELFIAKYALAISLSGKSLLIVVNVIIDLFTQIQTHMFSSKYSNLIKKIKLNNKSR